MVEQGPHLQQQYNLSSWIPNLIKFGLEIVFDAIKVEFSEIRIAMLSSHCYLIVYGIPYTYTNSLPSYIPTYVHSYYMIWTS